MMKRMLLGLLGLLLVVVAFGVYKTFRVPEDRWVVTHRFPACPERPSCVSSVAQDDVHKIEPLHYVGDAAAARQKLEDVIRRLPLTDIEASSPEYLHAVFQTPTMHFHDDVELLIQPDGVIQVRSISRFGYRDHGVNRARVERIREALSGIPRVGPKS